MSTRTPIASIVSSSNASSVTFTGIPQFYTDLILNISVKHSSTVENHRLRFNGDTTASYADLRIFGNGSSAFTDSRENGTSILLGEMSTSQYGADKWFIPQYTNTSMHKRIVGRSGNIGGNAQAGTGEYRSYSAITSITIFAGSGNFVNDSTFNLYGIASGSTKASGGIVTTDGTYFYHTFKTSGFFTPSQELTADMLVVAGGGGGGADAPGAGGGAGGVRAVTSQSLTANAAYTITIGAGAAGSTTGDAVNGNNSSVSGSGFSTLTSSGGGGGAGLPAAGLSGGSGGGAAGYRYSGGSFASASGGAGNSGSYSPVEGYAGGGWTLSGNTNRFTAGGGGGAGGVGTSVTNASSQAGNGGVGTDTYNSINFSSWLSATSSGVGGKVAGGGGGGGYTDPAGTAVNGGGAGGGGTPADTSANGTSATANTGGGGGGGLDGGNGGSGLVIVRYAV